ncbi:extracellular solute-binding protein [Anaerotruncus rubiinfantis]|uniref:extracellular solute-binding protein n=1 Tax=Anaerotruncus rubiinfantis TaxID=1720200 RepID=UPI0008332BCE|nr:extracellular solute-binding protein [Anaerotruncus rubiinfantis]
MKNAHRLLSVLLSVILLSAACAGCTKKESGGSSSGTASGGTGTPTGTPELYIYSSKGETATQFEAMCKAYEQETGVKVRSFSIGSGQDHMETLRAEMQGKAADQPAIFTIQGYKELIEWRDSGAAYNFEKAPAGAFKDMVDAIPENMRLTTDGADSYGVPYNVEGYGYILDHRMLADLMDADETAVFNDLVASSYDEFAAFVQAVDAYIKAPSAASVTLNGNSYAFKAEKSNLANNLTGVFAVAASEKWTYGDHMVNVALNAVFPNVASAANATDEQLEQLRGPIRDFAKALDLKTTYLAGSDGPAARGQDFIVATNYGYDPTLQRFVDGKALFMKNGNWVAPAIANLDADMAAHLTFVPVKLPITQEEIQVEGLTVEKFNSSIPVFVPMYYAINANKDMATIEAAEAFLVWLNTSETGKRYVTDEFDFIPYNADPSTTELNNALGNSILAYMETGHTLAAPYHGAPASWGGDTVGLELMENYLTKPAWTDEDYDAIADFAITKWRDMRG